MKALLGHNSPDSAFMVSDYPYGRDRCRIRFWLESDPKKGFRFCSQTEHPKKLIWNAPKKSTYSLLAGCMFLDHKGHVVWDGLSEYSSAENVRDFIARFPDADLSRLKAWCMQKAVFSSSMASGKVFFTMNGVKQPMSEAEALRHQVEADAWKECSLSITKF